MDELKPDLSSKIANVSLLCALLVVWLHLWGPVNTHSIAGRLYALTHFRHTAVPFFFVFSGYFLAGHVAERQWWRNALSKRWRSLLVPYFVWSLIICVFTAAWAREASPFLMVLASVGLDPFRHPLAMPLWYLRTLMVYVVVSPVLVWALRRKPVALLTGAFAAFVGLSDWYQPGSWRYTIAYFLGFGNLFFFVLGIAFRLKLVSLLKSRRLLWISLLGFVPALGHFGAWASMVLSLQIVLMMYAIWYVMPSWCLPRGVVTLTFPLYLLHWIVLDWCNRVLGDDVETLGRLGGRFVLIVAGSAIISLLLRRFLPRLSTVLWGGR